MDFYVPNPVQEKAHRSKAKIIAYVGGNRAGKCLPMDTPILMSDGIFKSLLDIKVGDRVVSQDGYGIVLNKIDSGVRNCYKVTFEDRGYLVASEEHHFPVAYGSGRKFKERTIGELVKRKKVSIPKKARFLSYKNIEFDNNKELLLHPYLVGALLGDGCLRTNTNFSNIDKSVLKKVEFHLNEIDFTLKKISSCDYRIKTIDKIHRTTSGRFGVSKFRKLIKQYKLDCNADKKFVPEDYLTSSVENRKQLLAGLIDTDGSLNEFCSISERLRNNFVFLIRSLGGKATLVGENRVYWRLNEFLPLQLKRKQKISKRNPNYLHRVVKSVEFIGRRLCGDIEVSNPAHTFVSWDWIVTGNTTLGAMEVAWHITKKYPDWFPKERRFDRPVKIRIATDKFFKIDTVIEPKLRTYLPKGEITKVRRSPQGYVTKLHTKDGSFIEFLTMEQDQMAFEGQDLDLFWGDEPVNRQRYIATQRGLIDRGGQTLLTFTPLVEPWMKEEIVDRVDGKNIEVFSADIRENKFDVKGNPILLEEDIQKFEDMLTDEEKETRLHGKFFHLRGVVYRELCDRHLLDDFSYEPGYPVICVLDPHDRLPHHMIWAMLDRTDDVYVMYEKVMTGTVKELAASIRAIEKYFGWNVSRRLIDPNFGRKNLISTGMSVKEELYKYGVGFFEANDQKEAGRLAVKGYLHFDVKRPIDLNNKPKLYFVKYATPKTIHSMRNYQYDEWASGKDIDPKEKEKPKDTHGADCVRYLCISLPKFDGYRTFEPVFNEAIY